MKRAGFIKFINDCGIMDDRHILMTKPGIICGTDYKKSSHANWAVWYVDEMAELQFLYLVKPGINQKYQNNR